MTNTIDSDRWDAIRKGTEYGDMAWLKQLVHKYEGYFAANFENIKFVPSESKSQLEVDFEWFFTWRLKLTDFPETFWCDGVKVRNFSRVGRRTYNIRAEIWIGPESDVSKLYTTDISGCLKTKTKFNGLEEYNFMIDYDNKTFVIGKI